MYLSRRLNRSLAPPDRVSLNVTLRCNLKCTMCTTCYDAPELSLPEIKGIIDQTADWGVEVFNPLGGEPFMRGDIEEILSYAVQRGFYVTVTTNGTLITEKRAKAIAAIPPDRLHFNISLDGDAESNDEIRSAGMWERAIAGYRRIREADALAGNARRKILANTILHARNADRFLQILDEQASLGFDGVQVLNLFRQGSDVPAEASALWFHPDKLDALKNLSEQLARRAESQGVVGYRIQNAPGSLRRIPEYYRDDLKPLDAPCWAGWKELYINADGQAIMCDGQLDFLKGGFGSVREQTLKELWSSPALRERREVVRQCSTPCVQDCYLRGESDSATSLVADASRLIGQRVRGRVQQLRPPVAVTEDACLRLELTDVCPCDDPACTTPKHRWDWLTREITEGVKASDWTRYRDTGRVDFGRGFMGLDVVRSVVNDLRAQRLRFTSIAVRWRGEPTLHPEIQPILELLLDAISKGAVAERLVIETDGRFLTEGLVGLTSHPAQQTWRLDADRGGLGSVKSARQRLSQGRHPGVDIQTVFVARDDLEVETIASVGLPVMMGEPTERGDAVWVRRGSGDHYQADQAATAAVLDLAARLGLPAPITTDNRPQPLIGQSLKPTISWDGKVTFDEQDTQLAVPVGDVVHSTFTEAWAARYKS